MTQVYFRNGKVSAPYKDAYNYTRWNYHGDVIRTSRLVPGKPDKYSLHIHNQKETLGTDRIVLHHPNPDLPADIVTNHHGTVSERFTDKSGRLHSESGPAVVKTFADRSETVEFWVHGKELKKGEKWRYANKLLKKQDTKGSVFVKRYVKGKLRLVRSVHASEFC